MMEFLRQTVEWQNWGMNAISVAAVGTVILTLFQGWSFLRQGKAIWRERSGQAVSVRIFGYLFFYFMAAIDYSIHQRSLSLLFNSLLFLTLAPTVVGLIRFKRLLFGEAACLIAFGAMPIWMLISKDKETAFFILLVGIVVFLVSQPYELWITKKPGTVDPTVFVVAVVVNTFWFGYGYLIDDIALATINPICGVINATSLFLWVRYDRHTNPVRPEPYIGLVIRNSAKNFFVNSIPMTGIMALAISAALWGLLDLLGLPVDFRQLFTLFFVVILVIDLLCKAFWIIWGSRSLLRWTVKTFEVSRKEAIEALFRYELHGKKGFNRWNRNDFRASLIVARAVRGGHRS